MSLSHSRFALVGSVVPSSSSSSSRPNPKFVYFFEEGLKGETEDGVSDKKQKPRLKNEIGSILGLDSNQIETRPNPTQLVRGMDIG